MAQRRKSRKNLFGFGKKTTHSPKLVQDAYEAGRRSGDTSQFKSWVSRQGDDLHGSFKRRLEKRYRAGVASLMNEEKKEAKREKSEREKQAAHDGKVLRERAWEAQREAKKEAKEEESEIVLDVASALNNLGMKMAEAKRKAKSGFKAGDSFNDLFNRIMSKNQQLRSNPRNPNRDALYRAAVKADDRFQAALTKKYGSRAGDMRYRTRDLPPDIRKLGSEYQAAMEKWRTSSNPPKFDKCVADVKASLKKAKRPGNAYAICTSAGTRNPELSRGTRVSWSDPHRGTRHTGTIEGYSKTTKPWKVYQIKDDKTGTVYDVHPDRVRASRNPAKPKAPASQTPGSMIPYLLNLVTYWNGVAAKARAEGRSVAHAVKFRKRAESRLQIWQEHAQAKNPKKARNYQSVVWSAKQGSTTAEVYKTGPHKYVVEFSNGSHARASSFAGAQAIARLRLHEIASNPVPKEVQVIPGVSYADTITRAAQRIGAGVTKSAKGLLRKIGKKKNPVDVAVKRYEEFHGYPVNEINEVESKEHRHSVTYGLARLIALNVIDVNGKQLPPLISNGFKFEGPIKFAYLTFDKSGKLLSPKQAAEAAGVDEEDAGYWSEGKVGADKIVWLTAGEDNKQLLLDGGDQSLDLKALGFSDRDWHDSMFIGTILRVWYRTRKKFEGDEEVDFFHDFGNEGSRGVYPLLIYKPKNPSLEIAGGRYEIAKPDRSIGNVSPGIVG
jgi:hypothetical protein